MSVKFVVSSTADLPQNIKEKVSVVPLNLHFGEEEYLDGVNITSQEFYEKLVESDVLPTTSQPTPLAFEEAFRPLVEAGHEVVCVSISAKLSGTYQSACIAAGEFPGKVFVLDSNTVAIGESILIAYGLELAEKGFSAEEITWKLMQKRDKVHLVALLDTLEYLKKGGRISKTVAFAGGLLNIKPVIGVVDGEVKMLGKARGSKQGNNLLVQEIAKAGGVDFSKPIMLGYTGMSDALLRKYVADSAALWEGHVEDLPSMIIGSVIGTHAGPGAVAVAFFSANCEE